MQHPRRRAQPRGLAALAAMLTVIGIGAVLSVTPVVAQAPLSGSFVGQMESSDARIGIITSRETVVAYVCDGEQAHWFHGVVVDGVAALTSASGAALAIDLRGSTPSGTVILPSGAVFSFTTEAAAGTD